MKIEARRLVIGTKPKPDWVGRNSTMKVEFSAAENHNYNKGTKENPEWVTKSTSWFNLEAWGDVAKEILEQKLAVGDIISITGSHKIDKVQKENEKARYYSVYKIIEFEKHDYNNED